MSHYNEDSNKIKQEHDEDDYDIGIDINILDEKFEPHHKKNLPHDDSYKRSSTQPSDPNKDKSIKDQKSSYPPEKMEKRGSKDYTEKDREKSLKQDIKSMDSSSNLKTSSKNPAGIKKDDSQKNKQTSETSSKRKEEKDNKAGKQRYREADDSEFCVHFYIQSVYLSPNTKIDEFLTAVRERINKAGACEYVQIAHYFENEVKLSVGMKYDNDALAILNRKRMILLYNRDNKLYETKPVIAPSFEMYCLAKKTDSGQNSTRKPEKVTYEKKKYSSPSRSNSRSKRKRKSEDSRKKDSGHHHNYVRRSNYEKNVMKTQEKRFRSGSRSRDDPSKKNKYHRKSSPDSHYKQRMSSRSRSPKAQKNRSRSRSRAHEHDHDHRSYNKFDKKFVVTKQPIMAFKDEKPLVNDQPNLAPQLSNSLFQAGNMPIVDNNSSNLLNMAYVMNQQLQNSGAFETKPDFVQFTHHNLSTASNMSMPIAQNAQFNQDTGMDKPKKEGSELVFGAASLSNNASNANFNENNLESSYSHVNANVPALNTVVKTSSKNITITNNGNKKVININSRKKDSVAMLNPMQTVSTVQNEPVTNDCICYLLGIPQSFSVTDVLFAIKQVNAEIEKITTKEEIDKFLIDAPVDYQWEQSFDMDYLKVIFPNTKSTDNLIVHSLKIMQNSIIVLPFFPNKPLIDLLDYHEIKIITSPKVDQLFIYQSFSVYGDIVNIIEEPSHTGSSFIIIYAHHNSVKRINPMPQQNYQIQLENGDTINFFIQRMDKPIPVKRPAANETISARFNYNTINMIQQSYQKNEYKAMTNPNVAVTANNQTIKLANEIKKPEGERVSKEKIELKREKNESPMDNKMEKKSYKQNYKNYNRNYSESPQDYKYKGNYQDNYRNNNNNYRYNNNNGGGGGYGNNSSSNYNQRDNYHNNNNNRDYNNNTQRKNYHSNTNRNDNNYKNYGGNRGENKYYDNNMNRNYQNRRNNY